MKKKLKNKRSIYTLHAILRNSGVHKDKRNKRNKFNNLWKKELNG